MIFRQEEVREWVSISLFNECISIVFNKHTSNLNTVYAHFFGLWILEWHPSAISQIPFLQSLSLSSEEEFFVVRSSESGGEVAEDADESDVVESGESFVSDFQDHFVIRTKNLFSRYIFVIFITKIIVLRFIRTISFNEA